MAGDDELLDRVRDALAGPSVRELRMFGGVSFMVDDKMALAVRGDGELLVRADPARAAELLAVEGARVAEMGRGRAMSPSWISVGREGLGTGEALAFWVGVALEHVRTLSRVKPRSRRRE